MGRAELARRLAGYSDSGSVLVGTSNMCRQSEQTTKLCSVPGVTQVAAVPNNPHVFRLTPGTDQRARIWSRGHGASYGQRERTINPSV
jgi:hypothetical protein